MHKVTFSVGLAFLIVFSLFSSITILRIEDVNAQVTVPKNYIQTVNDPYINSPYAWENFTTGLDPDSYSNIPGISAYWYDWVNVTIGTSYGPYGEPEFKNWTIQNHSGNNDTVLVCLGGGQFGYCRPAIETFDPFSEYLTVITNVDTCYYWSYSWVKPLADALHTMGFTYVHFLGFSSGAMCVASYLVHYDEGCFESGIVISGYLNQTYTGYPTIWAMANDADNVTTPINIITPTSDIPPLYGNATLQAEQFYGNLPGGLTKELHYFDGGHVVFWYYEVGTGKTAYEVVGEWINASYPEDFGTFTAYAKREGADEWGDCIARQGYYPHLNSYCLDWNNKIIKPMLHYPYIPANIGDDKIILQASGKHSDPLWYDNFPPFNKAPQGPTIGATIMLYFNVFVHDNLNGGDKWLFNFHEPNPFAGPNMFLLEIFLTRWVVPPWGIDFESQPPGSFWFEQFCVGTTHDADWHFITCPFDMPVNDQWYYFIYDVGNKLREAVDNIEEWSTIDMPWPIPDIVGYEVLGFQLMTIAMGVESIGGSWLFQFGDVSLTDMRWGTGQPYTNTMMAEIKTRADGNQYIPKLSGIIGSPNVLRPYKTYTKDALDSDINDDGYVNAKDATRLGYRFGSMESDPDGGPTYTSWDYTCDITKDGFVNAMDAIRLGVTFGQTGTYQTGVETLKVWMQEFDVSGLGLYWPDPPPGYVGPPWSVMRTVPYTCHLYLEMWDIIDWPFHVGRTISFNPFQNYMGKAIFYNGTTLNQTGNCFYAYAYPIHD